MLCWSSQPVRWRCAWQLTLMPCHVVYWTMALKSPESVKIKPEIQTNDHSISGDYSWLNLKIWRKAPWHSSCSDTDLIPALQVRQLNQNRRQDPANRKGQPLCGFTQHLSVCFWQKTFCLITLSINHSLAFTHFPFHTSTNSTRRERKSSPCCQR